MCAPTRRPQQKAHIYPGFQGIAAAEIPVRGENTQDFFNKRHRKSQHDGGKGGGFFMALTWIWVGMVCIALVFGAATGQSAAVGAAAAQGVQQAITFCLTVGGMICLWSGVMEVMRRSGIAAGLSKLLQPVLRRLFPHASRDAQTLDALSMNVSANLLGLGNAATPAGVRAAQAMAREIRGDAASDELCLLVVLNTASIQLLPVTIAAVRETAGAAVPFDILPAVWVTSLCSVTVGLLTGKGLARIWR